MKNHERDVEAVKVLGPVMNSLENLYDRWRGEKNVSNWCGYVKEMKRQVEEAGAIFVKAKKRPWGCVCTMDGVSYGIEITSKRAIIYRVLY